MKKITIILPIYKLDPEDIGMLNNALLSIEDFHNDVKVKLVAPVGLKPKIENFDFGQKLEVIPQYNTGLNTEFTFQVNLGIEECDTEWFSILEIDDEYKKVWLSSMNEYINAFTDIDVFLPIVKDVNVDGKFTNYTNESVWAYGFTDKQGFLNNELLLEYQNYQTSGGLYKTQVIKDNGSFKDNIKLTFSYELFLRLSNNGVKIMVVPKIGYQHVNFRENSLFWSYKNDENMKLSEDEVKFWLDIAKKEYYFKNKRDVKYEKK
jgi:hypothetical protein